MTSVLHHVEVNDGAFVDLACGLVGAARRFDAILDRYAPPVASGASCTDASPTIDLLLGMIAVRRKLAAVLDMTPRGENNEEEPDFPRQGSWLR